LTVARPLFGTVRVTVKVTVCVPELPSLSEASSIES
jgi:hypothetical protein